MPRKKKDEIDLEEALARISKFSLEDIMGDAFARYSKYIIQDRAIPDIRDGLKPVQRRILYSMYKEHNTYDKPTRKSAKTVGDVIGNYHPHGDTSIYDAMVRMSQDWKTRYPYIDMQGNNGSMDGDPPAAYRYTEARLSKISGELLRDIDKDTVNMAPNFDDTVLEPTVLPARFPNLLVNGTTGISAGYATNIPPHNLGEVIDATIYRLEHPNSKLDKLMEFVKGPDFPTGGIIEGKQGLIDAYTTGKGKIIVRARTSFEEEKTLDRIVITEIPFEVNKALLVRKIDEIRIDKTIDGITEVRDETDKTGLRIAIDLKKSANKDLILNYLFKNTDLQISYNFNMVAIHNKEPRECGLEEILDAYIEHQRDYVLRRTRFDLAHFKDRLNIVEGLIKCISILDEVVHTIRHSKDKADAKKNLMEKYEFNERQAEAIVMLQLYKLTNTDVVTLETELENLKKIVAGLEKILSDENVLKEVQKNELKNVKKEYNLERITEIKDEITEISIDKEAMIPKEDVIVSITKDGYVKRTSYKSYKASENDIQSIKEGDYLLGLYELNTKDFVLLFTNKGNYLYVPVYLLPDTKWKDAGKHISNIIKMEELENIVSVIPVTDFNKNVDVTIGTRLGMIKRTHLKDFKALRFNKPITCIKLKGNDEVISAFLTLNSDIFISTTKYGLWFSAIDVPVIGLKASGVKSISLKEDEVTSISNFDPSTENMILVITREGTGKRVKVTEFDKLTRAKRGVHLLKEVKSHPYHIVFTTITDNKSNIILKSNEIVSIKPTEIPILDRYSTGSNIYKGTVENASIEANLTKNEDLEQEANLVSNIEINKDYKTKEKVSLKEIDDRLMTIDDFLKDK